MLILIFWWSPQLKFLTAMSSLFLTSTQRTVSTSFLLIYALCMHINEHETWDGTRQKQKDKEEEVGLSANYFSKKWLTDKPLEAEVWRCFQTNSVVLRLCVTQTHDTWPTTFTLTYLDVHTKERPSICMCLKASIEQLRKPVKDHSTVKAQRFPFCVWQRCKWRKQIPVPHNAKGRLFNCFPHFVVSPVNGVPGFVVRALCKQFSLNLLLQPFTTYWVGPVMVTIF